MARRIIGGKLSTPRAERPTPNFRKFFRPSVAEWGLTSHNSSREMIEPPYRTVAVASTFSPRFLLVLAEAKRIRDRLCQEMHLIFVGARDEETTRRFTSALRELELPENSPIHYQ